MIYRNILQKKKNYLAPLEIIKKSYQKFFVVVKLKVCPRGF